MALIRGFVKKNHNVGRLGTACGRLWSHWHFAPHYKSKIFFYLLHKTIQGTEQIQKWIKNHEWSTNTEKIVIWRANAVLYCITSNTDNSKTKRHLQNLIFLSFTSIKNTLLEKKIQYKNIKNQYILEFAQNLNWAPDFRNLDKKSNQ